jgi:hypothetical protein
MASRLILLPIVPEFEPALSLRLRDCVTPTTWLAGGKAWCGICGEVSFSGDEAGLVLKGDDRFEMLPPPAVRSASK